MRWLLTLVLIFVMLCQSLFAAEVKNLKTGQIGDRGFAQYDLVGKPGEKRTNVTVFIVIGGERYPSKKLSLSGDFGKGVKVGTGKKIWWNVLKDMPGGFDGEAVWDVVASGRSVVVAKSSSAVIPKAEIAQNLFRVSDLTAIDTRNGLMWTRNGNLAGRAMSWQEAMNFSNELNYAGYNDWRLPTKEELLLLAKSSKQNPKNFEELGFLNLVLNDYYWTSSIVTNGSSGMIISTVLLRLEMVNIATYASPSVRSNVRRITNTEMTEDVPHYVLAVRSVK